jgi:hypothetical protein
MRKPGRQEEGRRVQRFSVRQKGPSVTFTTETTAGDPEVRRQKAESEKSRDDRRRKIQRRPPNQKASAHRDNPFHEMAKPGPI